MPKLINFTAAAARLVQPPAHREPPRINPAQLWIERHKPGHSRTVAGWRADRVAQLLGYADWATCPWHALEYGDIMRVRGDLFALVEADAYTPGTANSLLSTAQGIMAEVWRLGVGRPPEDRYLDAEALEVIRQIEAVPGKRMRRERRTITDAEIATLLAHCAADVSPRGVRDAALVAMATATGLRASEYAALIMADYDAAGARLRIPQIKTQVSDQDVWLPFEPPASDYLGRWLARRGRSPGVIFTRLERGGLGVIDAVSPSAITHILKRRGEECGIEGVTTHAFRRAFVTRILTHTGDLAMAARLARHAATTTTAKYYDMRADAEMRETVRRLPWPGGGSG